MACFSIGIQGMMKEREIRKKEAAGRKPVHSFVEAFVSAQTRHRAWIIQTPAVQNVKFHEFP